MSDLFGLNASRAYSITESDKRMGFTLNGLADLLDRILEPICKIIFIISTIAAGIMALPITLDVLARFALAKSVPGIVEIEEYFMIIIVFLSLAFAQKKEGHIAIDLLTGKLSTRTNELLNTFNSLTCTVFFGLVTWQTVLTAINKAGQYSTMLKIPISIFLAVTAFGLAMLTMILFQQFLRHLSRNIEARSWLGLVLVVAACVAVLTIPWWTKALPWQASRLGYGGLGMALMMTLLLLGMPIGFAMALVGFAGIGIFGFNLGPALSTLGVAPYSTTASFILAVAPLFIFMGLLASEAGISSDLFDTAYKWLGRMPGGLAMSAVAGCAGFSAVCGDSMSTAVTMGSVALPEMKRKKYNPGLACGALAAGGTLGILIPPSVGFIFYAIVTEESVGKLFIAGIVPGCLLAVVFMAIVWFLAVRNPELAPRGDAVSIKDKLISLKGILGMLTLFVLILGGILGGVFSPTEGGGIGVVGAFILGLVRRRISWAGLVRACEGTVMITTKLLMILIGVGVLGYFLAASRLPFDLARIVTENGYSRYVVLMGIIGLYIIMGCLMNVIPMILLTLPAIFPTVKAMGFDPIWFGVVTVMLMEMGQITPPVGVNVFALTSVAEGVSMTEIFRGIIPFFLGMVGTLILIILFPVIATGLVNLLF